MNPVHFRLLSAPDGAAYQRLRLEALQTNPEAFYATFDGESQRHEQAFSTELDMAYAPPTFGFYGLFLDDTLIGFCQVGHSYLPKQQHVAHLYNLYVTPEHRGHGYAKELLNHILTQLRQHEHIQVIYLSCLAHNKPARQFYQGFGFKRCGIRPRASYWHQVYDDEIELVLFLK